MTQTKTKINGNRGDCQTNGIRFLRQWLGDTFQARAQKQPRFNKIELLFYFSALEPYTRPLSRMTVSHRTIRGRGDPQTFSFNGRRETLASVRRLSCWLRHGKRKKQLAYLPILLSPHHDDHVVFWLLLLSRFPPILLHLISPISPFPSIAFFALGFGSFVVFFLISDFIS